MAQTCCLSCGLKDLGLGSQLVNYAKLTFISIPEILVMKHFYINSLMHHLGKGKRNAVLKLCESLIEAHGREYAPLFHPGYFYKNNYSITSLNNGSQVIYGQVGSEEVLEILRDGNSLTTTEDIIADMKLACVKIAESNNISKNLAGFVLNKAIRITIRHQQLEVMHSSEVTEMIQLYRCNESFQAMFHELFYYLEKIDSVSLILVDYTRGSPLINEWLKFFSNIYGGRTLQTCVFILSLDDYGTHGTTSVQEIKHYVNFDIDFDCKVKWLDLTSIDPNLATVEKVDPFPLQYDEQ